jgi:tetratricopeptide (TPR) repeat protein
LIAVFPGLTWLLISDESWKRSEKIAAVGVGASIAAAIAIYIGSRLGERRAATLATPVGPGRDDSALEGRARGDDVVVASQKNRILFNLPTVAASFTGRGQELDELKRSFVIADRAVIAQTIGGLGGVGKSQLAARYVQQHASEYEVVAWIRAEDGGIADLAQLAARLDLPVAGLSPSDRAQRAREWLSECEQRWLLVLDNIESPEQLQGLVSRTGSGRVLVTSRDRSLRQFGPMLTLAVFDEDTATAYLVDRAGRPDDTRAARELARALGCLPLALSHAAAYCQSGTSFTDYLALLDELPARELFDSHPELSYAQTVGSTWKVSIHAASADAALATDLLEMAAHLGPDAIPKSLFSGIVDADTAVGRKRLADGFNALGRFSLAIVDDTTVSVHRLLQKTVRDDAAARTDPTAALRALAALEDAFPYDVRLPANWPLCEQLLPHGLALADALFQPGDGAPKLINLLNRASHYLNRAEPGQRSLATARIILRHAERVLDAEHPATLTSRRHLAMAYYNTGRVGEAMAILEALLADSKRILGAEHPDTLATRGDLARTYRADGRAGEAITIFEQLSADREQILGAEHPDTLRTRHNLGRAYLDGGRLGEAIAVFEQLLAHREQIFGAAHPETLGARHNLAWGYLQAERIADARAIFEALLADNKRILGAEHSDTLRARHYLACAYLEERRVDKAIEILEPLLADSERILGAEHPRTLRTRHSLACAYLTVDRVGDAIEILEPLLADSERILGAAHPDTVRTRHTGHRLPVAEGTSSAGRVLTRNGPQIRLVLVIAYASQVGRTPFPPTQRPPASSERPRASATGARVEIVAGIQRFGRSGWSEAISSSSRTSPRPRLLAADSSVSVGQATCDPTRLLRRACGSRKPG